MEDSFETKIETKTEIESSNEQPTEEDSSSSSNESVSDEASSLPLPRKILPARVTRGRRMGKLVGEIAEADEMFWNQDAFREDESDESVAESDITSDSSDGSDSADSDIDKPEPEDDDEEEGGEGGGVGRKSGPGIKKKNTSGAASGNALTSAWDDDGGKKKGRYVDPALRGQRGGGTTTSTGGVNFELLAAKAKAILEAQTVGISINNVGVLSSEKEGSSINLKVERKSSKRKLGDTTVKGLLLDSITNSATTTVSSSSSARLSVRASTQVMTELVKLKEKEFEHQKIQKQETSKRLRDEGDDSEDARDSLPAKKLSQSESLIQAAKTTVENLLSLEALLSEKRDEEESGGGKVDRSGLFKARGFPAGTPLLRFLSKRGQADTLTFTEVDDFPRTIKNSSEGIVVLEKCSRTGKIAKYRDPQTGKPYVDMETYKLIRMDGNEK